MTGCVNHSILAKDKFPFSLRQGWGIQVVRAQICRDSLKQALCQKDLTLKTTSAPTDQEQAAFSKFQFCHLQRDQPVPACVVLMVPGIQCALMASENCYNCTGLGELLQSLLAYTHHTGRVASPIRDLFR